jgi:hypothetical protein
MDLVSAAVPSPHFASLDTEFSRSQYTTGLKSLYATIA